MKKRGPRSLEVRARISASLKGRKKSAATRARMSAAQKGRKLSPEHCAKIGDLKRGLVHTPETRAKLSAALMGRKKSPEHCANISAARKGMVFTPEHRAHIRKARLGQKASIAARANMSVAQIGLVKQPHTLAAKARISIGMRAYHREHPPRTGSDHPLWQARDRVYGSDFTRDLRRIVRWLYSGRCFLCGTPPIRRVMDVHHINYNKKNNTLDNLIPLCRSCHAMTGTRRDYWPWFFRLRLRIFPFNSWELVAWDVC